MRFTSYRIRTLFLVVALVSGSCSFYGARLRRAILQRDAIERLEPLAGGLDVLDDEVPEALWQRALLGKYPRLEEIDLGLTEARDEIFDADLAHLEAFPELRELNLYGHITNSGAESIADLRNLQVLTITETKGDRINGDFLHHIANLRDLRCLILQTSFDSYQNWTLTFTGESLSELRKLSSLRTLRIAVQHDRDLMYISQISKLEELDLYGSTISGKGLGYLNQLSNLQILSLFSTSISCSFLDELLKLPQLEQIDAQVDGFNDDALLQLAKISTLKRIIVIVSASEVTDNGIEKFISIRPDVEFSHFLDWQCNGGVP